MAALAPPTMDDKAEIHTPGWERLYNAREYLRREASTFDLHTRERNDNFHARVLLCNMMRLIENLEIMEEAIPGRLALWA